MPVNNNSCNDCKTNEIDNIETEITLKTENCVNENIFEMENLIDFENEIECES